MLIRRTDAGYGRAAFLLIATACGGRSMLGTDDVESQPQSAGGDRGASTSGGQSLRGLGGSGGAMASGGARNTSQWVVKETPYTPDSPDGPVCNDCWNPGQPSFLRVWAASADHVWIVAKQVNYKAPSTTSILWWNATTAIWSYPPDMPGLAYGSTQIDGTVDSNAFSLALPDSDEVSVNRWNGMNWIPLGNPEGSLISVDAPEDAWVCCSSPQPAGSTGRSLAHWDGDGWTSSTLPDSSFEPLAMFAVSGRELWLSGKGGKVLHLTGSDWNAVKTSMKDNITAIWGDAGSIWMLSGAHVLRFDGDSEVALPQPDIAGTTLTSVWGSEDSLWVVGSPGIVLHWNGQGWEREGVPTKGGLYSIFGIANEFVWAVGEGTLIERRL